MKKLTFIMLLSALAVPFTAIGGGARVSRYNLFSTDSGQIVIFGGNGLGEGIFTDYYLPKK